LDTCSLSVPERQEFVGWKHLSTSIQAKPV
jgi:hypothetical protein